MIAEKARTTTNNTDALRFATLQAQFAKLGHTFRQSGPSDGPVGYMAERWGMARHLPTLADAKTFLVKIGGNA
ncbi:MAG: hypothetical protein Q7K57_26415 [Burkholderiaceae bacterium]|nr:hypothetical protein [Burkholderiaceae bacterium]